MISSRRALPLFLLTACPGDLAEEADTSPGSTAPATESDGPDDGQSETGAEPTTGKVPTTGEVSTTGEVPTTGEVSTTGDATTTAADTTAGSTDTTDTTGAPAVCGDGMRDPGEDCDDADADDADACRSDCTPGPGSDLHEIPPLARFEHALVCITAVGDGLVLGGETWTDTDSRAWVRRVRLPGLDPIAWTFHDPDLSTGRHPTEAATAENGDIVIAGYYLTWSGDESDPVAHFWLARFTDAGEQVWNHDHHGMLFYPDDLELSPNGDIAVVGGGGLHVFDGAGQLVWTFTDESPSTSERYTGVAVDDDATIYVAGQRNPDRRVVTRGFAPDGTSLWTNLSEPFAPLSVHVRDLVWTPDDQLVHAARRYDVVLHAFLPGVSLGAVDTAGEPLWSQLWDSQSDNPVAVDGLLAADDGGFYVTGAFSSEPALEHTTLTRFTAEGEPVWTKQAVTDGGPSDATLAADGLLHVATRSAVVSFAP